MFKPLTICLALFAGQAAAETRIVADIAPVQSLVASVSGALPDVLMDGATDPHHFAMRPSQARLISGAELLVTVGPGLVPWLEDEAMVLNPDIKVLALASEGTEHPWLDPVEVTGWVDRIGASLAELDPEHAETYAAKAAVLGRELLDLEAEIRTRINALNGLELVTDHDALAAFADRFALEIVESIGDGHDHAPGAKHLSHLAHLAHDGHVDCVIVTSDENAEAAAELADESGAPLVTVDLLGAGLEAGPELHRSMMLRLADGLMGCAG